MRLFSPVRVGFLLLALTPAVLAQGGSSGGSLQVGYGTMESVEGEDLPIGSALFSLRQGGILVSEAAISAVRPVRAGRIFVDQDGSSTGVALVNPADSPIDIRFTLRDAVGAIFGEKTLNLGPHQHLPRFVNDEELFPMAPANFLGSLTFEVLTAGHRVAGVTIRLGVSARNTSLFATLPFASLDEDAEPAGLATQLVLPHIGAGRAGAALSLATQILLFNLSGSQVQGQIQLVRSDGQPLVATLDGVTASSFNYVIPANGVYRRTLSSDGPTVQGYAVITRTVGPRIPVASAVFRFRTDDGLISEAGVAAIPPTTRARIFVDNVGTQTGVAVARPGLPAGKVTFELFDRNGFSLETQERDVAAGGHLPIFAEELFPTRVTTGFRGIMEIRSNDPLVPITLKLTANLLGDLILTTLPVADLTLPFSSDTRIFPQIGFGGGLSTRLILLWPDRVNPGRARLRFTNSDATPMLLPITGTTDSEFVFLFNRGGARQVLPNNVATPQQLLLNFGMPAQEEIPLTRGGTTVVRTLVIDSAGDFRDDFDPVFESLDAGVAAVDRWGLVEGIQPGFVTLTTSLGPLVQVSTVQVSDFASGPPGFSVEGVAEDNAGLLYLTSPLTQQILTLESLEMLPEVYAGVDSTPGHLDTNRSDALFDTPTFLSLDKASNGLYLSDSANRRIRLVEAGSAGQVRTIAGTGAFGNQDGAAASATFSDPQGIALDDRGGLWIVDRGNHTIRRMDLATDMVSTIAGLAGQPGFQNGTGSEARFSMPTGVAFEAETSLQKLIRTESGEPPPPATVVVADTGNGALRRVRLDGLVETLSFDSDPASQGVPLSPFDAPTGVGIDPFGTIYVSEPERGRVSAILPDRRVVQIHEPKMLVNPRGISITGGGRLVVADGRDTLREIRFGAPSIDRILPSALELAGGQQVDIVGRSFSSEAVVSVSGRLPESIQIIDSTRIRIVTPPLRSDNLRLTVQTRGGTGQIFFQISTPPLADLPPGSLITVAGGGSYAGDGGPALQAITDRPLGLVFDAQGNIYLSDGIHHRIRRIDAQTGIIQTVAGQGFSRPFIDNVPALEATLSLPYGMAVTPEGDLLVADSQNHRIRKLFTSSRTLVTIAGTGNSPGLAGDGGLATQARLNSPFGVAVDSTGTVFIADTGNHAIRQIDPETQIITAVQFTVPSGQTQTLLSIPFSVNPDRQGGLLVADTGHNRIVRIADGVLQTIAGDGTRGFGGDGEPATSAVLAAPTMSIASADGNIYILDTANNRLRVVEAATGTISTRAGGTCCNLEDEVDPENAFLSSPYGLAMDGSGNLLISDFGNGLIRRLRARDGRIDSVAGRGSVGDQKPAPGAVLLLPRDVELDAESGALLIADEGGFRIRQVDEKGMIHTFAGNGKAFVTSDGSVVGIGDGRTATDAAVAPASLVFTADGFLFIADTASGRLRFVNPNKSLGSAVQGLALPLSIDVDSLDSVIVSESGRHRVIYLTVKGELFLLAGNVSGMGGSSGDGGDATKAFLNLSGGGGIAIDRSPGNLAAERFFIADTGNHRVRVIVNGVINNFAGSGAGKTSGDGGLATRAGVPFPIALAYDQSRDILYIATNDNRIRAVNQRGIIETVAGTGVFGYDGDGGDARNASFRFPGGMTVDPDGNLFVVDQFNHAVRLIRAPQ